MPAADAFDVLVIGAGSAGSVLAARLSEDPSRRVGVLEAGGFPTDPRVHDPLQWPFLEGSEIDWAYRTVPQAGTAGRVHSWPRGRAVGGSSTLNAMAHVRGHPADFDAWGEVAGQEWSFEALLPYFRRSERFSGGASEWHGGDGPLDVWLPAQLHPVAEAFMAAAEERGFAPSGDHNGRRMEGPARNSLTIRDGRRLTVADAYLAPVLDRPNLELLTGVVVERLLLDGGCARGVEARVDGRPRRIAADAVVLAGGAIASPLLLMRSGLGPPEELGAHGIPVIAELPAVGANLHDHLLGAGNLYAASRPLEPSRLQHSESLLYARRDGGPAPDVVVACAVAPITSDRFARPEPGTAFTLLFGVTHPRSRGCLRLGGPSAADAPLIDPAYLTEAYDRTTFRSALELAREVASAPALASWSAGELLPGPGVQDDAAVDRFVAEAAITHHHPVGTCAMGRDPARSVVDGALRVHGVERLWVADASVIPAITTGPVHAAVIAIAERAADGLVA